MPRSFIMKKIAVLLVCLTMANLMLTGCSVKQKQQTINYQRKLMQYLPKENKTTVNKAIDLSEGPKQSYNYNLGPNDLNFDIKIVNPY